MKRLNTKGFTIIELLIATVVFSIVLLVVSGAIIQFNKLYYKGVIVARTNEVSRTIGEDAARNVQYSKGILQGTAPSGTVPGVRCIGSKRYTYFLNQPLTDDSLTRMLVADSIPPSEGCVANEAAMVKTNPLPSGAKELLGTNMRLVIFSAAEQAAGDTKITVRVAYGDNNDDFETESGLITSCKAIVLGGQFCAVSDLTTYASKRL